MGQPCSAFHVHTHDENKTATSQQQEEEVEEVFCLAQQWKYLWTRTGPDQNKFVFDQDEPKD